MTKAGLKTVTDLIDDGLVPGEQRAALEDIARRYAVAIPPHLRAKLLQAEKRGPLARQFVPDPREADARPEDLADPIGDQIHTPVKGLVHRYRNRVLLKIVSVCPVYCRFCFRRDMIGPGQEAMLTENELSAALSYVSHHPEIEEVIMTGGDPLVLSPRRIAELTSAISDIAHVKVLRWHSRVPVVAPERVTADAVAALANTNKLVRVAVHANHPAELSTDAERASTRLIAANITLLSQSVLLRGVNDGVNVLTELFARFGQVGLEPYYLHHLDLAPGTHHFRVPVREGQALLNRVRHHHSALVMPRYMLDIPGGFGKVPLAATHVRLIELRHDRDLYRVRDPAGRCHIYHDLKPHVGHNV